MISAILIYGQRGEILASRVYREGLRRAITDAFRVEVISNAETSSPILTMGSTSFLHIRHNELYVVAVTRSDVDAIAVFEVLYRLCELCTAQFGHFDDTVCYRYVSQIYEILDEIVDYGYAQSTDAGLVKLSSSSDDRGDHIDDFVPTGSSSGIPGPQTVVNSLRRTLTSAKSGMSSQSSLSSRRDTTTTDNAVPWRRSDIKHRRNEIYLDVDEKLNATFEPSGSLLGASVNGLLKVKAHLSGLPHCQVDLDNYSVLENSQLHACANHAAFESAGVVQFVPPEGEFDLLRYRVSQDLKIPVKVQNTSDGHGELTVRIKCILDVKKHLTNVVVHIPLPPTSTSNSQRFKTTSGKAKFSAERTACEWKIARLPGQHDAILKISGSENLAGHGPILINFSISMFTSSSLRVQSLQVVEEQKYTTLKWVRYLTESGACEARTKTKS